MVVNLDYWINDSYKTGTGTTDIIPKFKYLASPAGQSSNASITLQLWSMVANNRPIVTSEYTDTGARPLTSIKVGDTSNGGEQVAIGGDPTNGYFNFGPGYINYTRFINNILKRHKLKSTFWPMGVNFTGANNLLGNSIGCNLAIPEQFSMTFVEIPSNFPSSWTDTTVTPNKTYTNTYNTSTIYHIETVQPMTLLAYVKNFQNAATGITPGFSIIKGTRLSVINDSIVWVQYNGLTVPSS